MALYHGKKGLSQQKVAKSVGVTFHYRLSSPARSQLFWVQFCSKKHFLAEKTSDPIFFKDQNMVRRNPESSNSTPIESLEVAKKSPERATSRATENNTLPPLKPRI